MPLLQKKIFAEIVQVFALTLFVVLCLILLGRGLKLRELLFGLDVSLFDTVMLFVYMAPTFLQLSAPISCMLAVFITFSRYESDREMTALRAGGISLYQLLPMPILFSCFVSLFTLWVAVYGISWGMYSFRDTIIEIATTRAKVVVQPGIFNKDIPGIVLYAKQVDPLSGFMSQVLVRDTSFSPSKDEEDNDYTDDDFDGENIHTSPFIAEGITILAPEGNISIDNTLGDLLFLLKDGKIYSTEEKKSTTINFREYIVRIPLASIFEGFDLDPVQPEEMSFNELREFSMEDYRIKQKQFYGETLEKMTANNRIDEKRLNDILIDAERFINKIIVEQHKRFVFPFACFVLGLLATPMAIACSGAKKQLGLAIAMSAFIFYYGILSMGINMGISGQLNPYIGIWLPNVFYILLALFAIYYYNNISYKG